MISVIMTVYNEPIKWVKESIESIANQTFKDIKLIIVIDNPAYDELQMIYNICDSVEIDCLIHVNESNFGLVHSLNTGLSYVDTEYIARMDSDDISNTNRFEMELDFLEKNELDFVASDITKVDEYRTPIKQEECLTTDLLGDDILKIEALQNILWHPTWLFKRELMSKLIGYRDIKFAEDYDFVVRALLNGYKIGMLKEKTLNKRIRSGAISEDHGLEQIITANRVAKMLKEKKIMPEEYLNVVVTLNEIEKFNFLKSTFNNRYSANFYNMGKFLIYLIASKTGFVFFRAVFIQKFGIRFSLRK